MSTKHARNYSTEHRNASVLRVLRESLTPLTPTVIAQRIGEPWCCLGTFGQSSAISPVLKRIKAVRVGPGKYIEPEDTQ